MAKYTTHFAVETPDGGTINRFHFSDFTGTEDERRAKAKEKADQARDGWMRNAPQYCGPTQTLQVVER